MNGQPLSPVPPMGWNSWNTFYDQISEDLIFETADAMADKGLLSAGYQYLIIDDCWAMKERDKDGNLAPDPEKFPHGIKSVADYVHAKGLKFGLYGCCGVRTCAGYPGSFEREFQDAAQFARWGVDYLKYDNCHRPASIPSHILYRRMGMALRNCGRKITFAVCQWGTENVREWIRSTGAQTFRSTVDIQDSWKSIEKIALSQIENQYSFPGCFNDMDILVAGMYGHGMNPETSMGGCTDEEYQTHFALWAMLGSPLMIGCDIRAMPEKTRLLLTNRELIAINQDPECASCYKAAVYGNPDAFVLVKPLSGGDYALGFFNFSDVRACMTLNFWDIGLSAVSGRGLRFHDCLSNRDAGVFQGQFSTEVPSHGCGIYRCGVVEL